MTHDPSPQQRLSDAERDEAASMLRDHFEAGRLDASEFDERLSGALSARFAGDFIPLFADLPDPRPNPHAVQPWASPLVPVAGSSLSLPTDAGGRGVARPQPTWLPLARKLLWPGAIALALITGNWWQFIALAIVLSIVLGHLTQQRRQPPPYLDK
ncbi:MAG: DUF1707 domain-containing protein [Nigerium sp.]|nr:DUF1707 domain-containing protein [Nigerium sp.]